MKLIKKQFGFSMIELMVATAVGLLVTTGILQILTNSSDSYRVHSALMRLHENGQFSMEFIARDLRNTDFWGCLGSKEDIRNNLDTGGSGYSGTYDDFTTGVEGQESVTGGSGLVAGTDTLTIRSARIIGSGLPLQAPYGPTSADPLNIPTGNGIDLGDILIVSDCLQGDIFQVTNGNANATGVVAHGIGVGSPGNSTPNLSKVYTENAFVYAPYTHIYEIRTGTNGMPALFLTDRNGQQELISGVGNMRVYYGEDTNGDGTPNRYVRAGSVTDMDNVISLRILLLVESEEDRITPDPQSYVFDGNTVTPTDHRLRRAYTTTIVLRNRGA